MGNQANNGSTSKQIRTKMKEIKEQYVEIELVNDLRLGQLQVLEKKETEETFALKCLEVNDS
jgi:hypothetical protein